MLEQIRSKTGVLIHKAFIRNPEEKRRRTCQVEIKEKEKLNIRPIIVVGPSGAGKGTVIGGFLEEHRNYRISVSCTSRLPREGEKDGVNYHFKTREQFEKLIEEGAFLEWEIVNGDFYGTLKGSVSKNTILEIEYKGALKVKEKYPETVLVFIAPPSVEILERRLRGRKTETEEQINRRLGRAEEEVENACKDEFDYVIVNDNLEEAKKQMESIFAVEGAKSKKAGSVDEVQAAVAEKCRDKQVVRHLLRQFKNRY